eukprot:6790301-Prorocentrum_lima.AAC.1
MNIRRRSKSCVINSMRKEGRTQSSGETTFKNKTLAELKKRAPDQWNNADTGTPPQTEEVRRVA